MSAGPGGIFGAIVSKAFKDADKDKSGFIDEKEVEGALIKYSKDLRLDNVTPEEVSKFFKDLDKDANNKIDEKEFGKLIQTMIKNRTK